MIRCSMNIRENCPRKCFWTKEIETEVKFNPGLSANRPSNNWAQDDTLIVRHPHGSLVTLQRWKVSSIAQPRNSTDKNIGIGVKVNIVAVAIEEQKRARIMMNAAWADGRAKTWLTVVVAYKPALAGPRDCTYVISEYVPLIKKKYKCGCSKDQHK